MNNKKIENVISVSLSIIGMIIVRRLNVAFIFILIFYVMGCINIFQLCEKKIKE
jgi:hypothetical protein